MEGSDVYGMVDAYKMSLVSDLVLPPKFKMPTFDNYDGTKCSFAHLYYNVLQKNDGIYK